MPVLSPPPANKQAKKVSKPQSPVSALAAGPAAGPSSIFQVAQQAESSGSLFTGSMFSVAQPVESVAPEHVVLDRSYEVPKSAHEEQPEVVVTPLFDVPPPPHEALAPESATPLFAEEKTATSRDAGSRRRRKRKSNEDAVDAVADATDDGVNDELDGE